MSKPKVLIFDIETSPMLGYIWSLWDQNVALNQLQKDWHLLSFSAKWLRDKKVIYHDQRNAKNIEDDSRLLKELHKLLDEADVVITQNGKSFDVKKVNARFILNGMKPPSPYRHIDTFLIAKKHFGFTSNKLEYMTDKLCTKYKKLKTTKFSGFTLWSECLKGNLKAWKEMEKYNKYDVLSLEELYLKLQPWDNSLNLNLYTDSLDNTCDCGGELIKYGFHYTPIAKHQRYRCTECGSTHRDSTNLFTKEKKKSLKKRL